MSYACRETCIRAELGVGDAGLEPQSFPQLTKARCELQRAPQAAWAGAEVSGHFETLLSLAQQSRCIYGCRTNLQTLGCELTAWSLVCLGAGFASFLLTRRAGGKACLEEKIEVTEFAPVAFLCSSQTETCDG